MKIAFLNIYSGLVNRGAERSTHELANHLAINHEIYIVQGGKENADSSYKTYIIAPFFKNCSDSSSSLLRKVYLDVWSINIFFFTFKVLFFLWREKFDIVVPINGGWQTLICRIFTWVSKSKIVVIGRAGVGRDDAWNLFCHPDAFVALTQAALSWTKKRAPKVLTVKISNAIDLKKFNPIGKKANITLQKPIVLCAGALFPNKNIDLTIKAVARIDNCQLIIAGDGPMKKELQDLGEKLLGKDRFMFISVPLSSMPEYYRAADIFTLVSGSGEAFGNVYLEAMATNKPVVATNDETRREIIGKAGLYVNPENINEYALVLQRALKNNFHNLPKLQAKKYSWEKIAQKYEKVFQSLS